jgi:hypothetical protein
MKKLLVSLLVVVVLGVAGFLAYKRWSARTIAQGQIALLNAELAYTTQLTEGLKRIASTPNTTAVTVVLSPSSLNRLLEGLSGVTMAIPDIQGQVEVKAVSVEFRDAFPEVRVDAHLTSSRVNGSLDARISATIEPQLPTDTPNTLQLFVRPLEIHPVATIGGATITVSRDVEAVLAAILAKYAESLPRVTIPLASSFQVNFPPTTQTIRVRTHDGALNGTLDFPTFSSSIAIVIKQVYFLTDGIHIVASTAKEAPELLPFKISPAPTVSADAMSAAVSGKQAAITSARAELESLITSLKINDADVLIEVAPQLLNSVLASFNSLTDAQRTVHYRTTVEEGQLYRTGGGGAGCGGYAELVGHNSASADVKVSSLATTFADNSLSLSADLSFSFAAQVTGHVNGPAGPHATNDLKCINVFGKDICTNVPGIAISCDSPVGGGVGLGSYGVSGNRGERITAQATFTSDNTSWLHYDVTIVSPTQVPITIEVGLGQLGTLGLPFTFQVPNTRIASGAAPAVFGNRGQLESKGPVQLLKQYDVSVQPVSSAMSAAGYRFKAKTNIAWLPASH